MQNKKQTAFHLAAKGGYLPCLRLLFVAVQCRGLLGSLPKVDKVNYLYITCPFSMNHIDRMNGTWHVMLVLTRKVMLK